MKNLHKIAQIKDADPVIKAWMSQFIGIHNYKYNRATKEYSVYSINTKTYKVMHELLDTGFYELLKPSLKRNPEYSTPGVIPPNLIIEG